MTWQRTTALIIVSTIVGLVIYDILAYRFGGDESTISKTLLGTSLTQKGFAIAFAFCFGVLFGHLFLPQTQI